MLLGTATLIAYEVSLFIPLQAPVQAETAPASPPASDASDGGIGDQAASASTGRSACENNVKQFLEDQRTDFAKFITTHFQSNKPASELIPVAMERFRQYRTAIRDRLNNFLPQGPLAESQRDGCTTAVTEDFTLMKELLRQHIISNAYAKKTTHLMDKYKEINDKLQKLNFTVAQTYGYFGGLAQKVPCYATKCNKQ